MSWFFVGAAVVSAVSAIASGDAQRKAAHTNADIFAQKAQIATDQANVNEEASRRHAAMVLGSEAAGAADSTGLTGTNADVYKQSATAAEMDALNVRYQGKLGALSNQDQSMFSNLQATQANSAGYLNAGAAALSSYGGYVNANARTRNRGYGLD